VSRKRNGRSPEAGGGSSGWLTTFNDLVTLLMVFFVLLFTMGSIDNKMMQEFQYALQSGLGVLGEGSRVAVSVQEGQTSGSLAELMSQAGGQPAPEAEGEEVQAIEETLAEFAAAPGVNVRYSKQGAHISFEDGLFFNFGKADINSSGFALLDKMAVLIHNMPGSVRVEGHTDNVPIHTRRFPSNWELSIARAVSVVKYFAEVGKINPARLSAVGYGESRPLAPNDSPDHRAKNRRVEIVLVMEGEK
jgi:chemotaxis protein MotB